MPIPDKYAPTAWTSELFTDLELPSGQLCQVRRPGVQGLVQLGLLDKVDSITSMVDQKHIKRVRGQKTIDQKSLMTDPKALMDAMTTIDKILTHVVVQPKLKLSFVEVDGQIIQIEESEYEDGVIYTSMVGIEDKMFIFNYAVGGSKDLEKFRERIGESVSSLDDE